MGANGIQKEYLLPVVENKESVLLLSATQEAHSAGFHQND